MKIREDRQGTMPRLGDIVRLELEGAPEDEFVVFVVINEEPDSGALFAVPADVPEPLLHGYSEMLITSKDDPVSGPLVLCLGKGHWVDKYTLRGGYVWSELSKVQLFRAQMIMSHVVRLADWGQDEAEAKTVQDDPLFQKWDEWMDKFSGSLYRLDRQEFNDRATRP